MIDNTKLNLWLKKTAWLNAPTNFSELSLMISDMAFRVLLSKMNFESLSICTLSNIDHQSPRFLAFLNRLTHVVYPKILDGTYTQADYTGDRVFFKKILLDYIFKLPLTKKIQAFKNILEKGHALNIFDIQTVIDEDTEDKIRKEIMLFNIFHQIYTHLTKDKDSHEHESLDDINLNTNEERNDLIGCCLNLTKQIYLFELAKWKSIKNIKIVLSETTAALISTSTILTDLFPDFATALAQQSKPVDNRYYRFFSTSPLIDDNAKNVTHTADVAYIGKSILNN